MNYKYILKIRTSASPNLFLDQIKLMLKDDEYLLPAMRGYLNFMKKTGRSYIPLSLQSEVIVSPSHECNLTRGLSPELTEFNKVSWTEKDKERFQTNSKKFLNEIISLYEKMGYDVEESILDDKIVDGIVKSFDEKAKKFTQMLTKDK